ncbi:TATA box binding protein associated factor (TAF) [Gracilaria domingensis]|nr:TATA box binding protein associated factor (TAF) [Gracilaria domingensis]
MAAKRAKSSNANALPHETLRVDTEVIRVIGQSMPSMPPFADSAAGTLAHDIEYRIREIVQDAMKFMKHSKRNKLTTNDINAALRLRNVAPILGFSDPKGNSHKLRDNGRSKQDKAYMMSPLSSAKGDLHPPLRPQFTAVDGSEDLFFVPDKEVTVKSVIETNMPLVPLDVNLSKHWLAVAGKQPSIPQNPTKKRKASYGENEDTEPVSKKQKVPTEVKPLVRHELSRELQLYLEQITTAVQGDDTKHLEQCLYAVAHEKGIAELLPYFTQFVFKCVTKCDNLPLMFSCMRLVNAILDNDVFDLRLYLQQVLPAVLTCILGKRFSGNPRDNHWALRDYTTTVMKKICDRYGQQYPDIQPRITKTCASALDSTKRPLTTHYGAIVGLAALGRRVLERHLLPRLERRTYLATVAKIVKNPNTKPVRREEACRVFGALFWAVSLVREPSNGSAKPSEVDVQLKHFVDYLPSAETIFKAGEVELGNRFYPHRHGKTETQLTCALLEERKAKR